MRDYQTKQNKGGLPDTINAERFGAGEFNSIAVENEQAVSYTKQTLAIADGTSETSDQLAKALFINGASATTWQDNGAVNAYALTPATGATGLRTPEGYPHFEGGMVVFLPGVTNTGPSTVKIGQTTGSYLGAKKILYPTGGTLNAGDMTSSKYQLAIYNGTADGGAGAFIWMGTLSTGATTIAELPRGYIDGYTMSNSAGDIDHDITVSIGTCRDSTDLVNMPKTFALTKRIDFAWTVGNGGGGMLSGAVATNTWYTMYAMKRDSDGNVDFGFDPNSATPTLPSGYTYFRRIGAVLTDASANIYEFIQKGDTFIWETPIIDYYLAAAGTGRHTVTMRSPPGVNCTLKVIGGTNAATSIWFGNPDVSNVTPVSGTTPPGAIFSSGLDAGVYLHATTNTSSQIGYKSSANANTTYITHHYVDRRGKE